MADSGAPQSDARFDRSTSLKLFLAALVVRILYSLLRDVGNPIPVGTDAQSYDAFARAILSGTAWITHPGPELFRPPGYPMVLAALYAITGRHLEIVQVLQSLVGAAAVVLVFEMGRRPFGRTPALLAAVWLLLNPLHLDYNGKLLRETWLVFLNVALLASLLLPDGRRTGGIARTAALFTILIHFDSRYVFHLPFFAVYYLIVAGGNDGAARQAVGAPAARAAAPPATRRDGYSAAPFHLRPAAAVRPALLFGVFVVLFSAPWAARNAVAYDHFVLIDTRALDRWGKKAQTAVTRDASDPGAALRKFEAGREARFDSLSAEERAAYRAGLRPRSGQPAKALFNFLEFWRIVHVKPEYRPLPDGRFAGPWSAEHNVASLLFMGLILPGFLLGTWRALANGDRVALLFIAFIIVHTLLHVLVHSVVRYRLPIEPLCALIAFREMSGWLPRKRGAAAVPENAAEPPVGAPA